MQAEMLQGTLLHYIVHYLANDLWHHVLSCVIGDMYVSVAYGVTVLLSWVGWYDFTAEFRSYFAVSAKFRSQNGSETPLRNPQVTILTPRSASSLGATGYLYGKTPLQRQHVTTEYTCCRPAYLLRGHYNTLSQRKQRYEIDWIAGSQNTSSLTCFCPNS